MLEAILKTLNKPVTHQTVINNRTTPVESEEVKNVFQFSLSEMFPAVTAQILGEVNLWQRRARTKHNIIQQGDKLSTP